MKAHDAQSVGSFHEGLHMLSLLGRLLLVFPFRWREHILWFAFGFSLLTPPHGSRGVYLIGSLGRIIWTRSAPGSSPLFSWA